MEEPGFDNEMKGGSFLAFFAPFQAYLDEEQGIREKITTVVREIDQAVRKILAELQVVHHNSKQHVIEKICVKANTDFLILKNKFTELTEQIPEGQYYRFHDQWKFVMQRVAFLAAFLVYLQHDRLITREEFAAMLGVKATRDEGFHVDIDDFLIGLLFLANELSRFAVNCVTAEEYERPQRISSFVSELDAGFRLLNLKNDFLRKKFDGLKYDLKKIEEVVYDIKIRGLAKS